jgi:hypothetical protein
MVLQVKIIKAKFLLYIILNSLCFFETAYAVAPYHSPCEEESRQIENNRNKFNKCIETKGSKEQCVWS